MARSIQEIYAQMVAEKTSYANLNALQPNIDDVQTLLNDLTTTSKAAKWRLFFYICAFAIWVLEMLMDEHKAELEARIAEARVGTKQWYRAEAMKYQIGDELEYINGKYQYAIIDEAKKIIKKCAVVVVNGQVIFKVAKSDGSLLSSPQLSAFRNYINKITFAGTVTQVESNSPDALQISYRIHYDPLVLDSTGKLLSDGVTLPVNKAVQDFISSIEFNGELVLTELTDAVQKAAGVVNPVLVSASAKYGVLPFAPIIDKYQTNSGQLLIDNITVTYIANV